MGDASISNLFPTIGRIFAVIILGYMLGKFKVITQRSAGAIGVIAGQIALPALLFQNMATLDLSQINWRFMAGILIARSLVFVGVFVITIIFTRPVDIGKPAILAIFSTQSNDFALGLPIVNALYGDGVGPGGFYYQSYIYLIAPIQVGILNPIGFFCLEYSLQKAKSVRSKSTVSIRALFTKTLWNLIINPVINMTLLGIVINVIVSKAIHGGDSNYDTDRNLKGWMKDFLSLLGDAYDACALLYLGICMVGNLKDFNGILVLKSVLLCSAKMILLPLITQLIMDALGLERDISTFGFVFGTFPTAPSVFVFASLFKCGVSLVGPASVFCTFLSAPIIYVSARMALVHSIDEDSYESIVNDTRTDSSMVSIVCLVITFCLFIMARRYRSHIHIFIMHLMVAMLLMCSGAIGITYIEKQTPWDYFSFTFFLGGVFAARLWSALLSLELVLMLLYRMNLIKVRWLLFLIIGWGLPFISATILVIVVAEVSENDSTLDEAFYLGDAQLVLSSVFLGISTLITTASLIFIVLRVIRRSRVTKGYANLSKDEVVISIPRINESTSPIDGNRPTHDKATNNATATATTPSPSESSRDNGNESTPLLDSKKDVDHTSYGESVADDEEHITFADIPMPGLWEEDKPGRNTDRIIILLFVLLASMIVGIFAVSYNVAHRHEKNGVYVEVDVLDAVMNFGQGLFLFLIFATEKNWITILIMNRIRNLFYRVENVIITDFQKLDSASRHVCTSFRAQHLKTLERELPSVKRYHLRTFEDVFTGTELVDWLISKQLVNSREDAVSYGEILLQGQVIEHVLQEHYFHDENYFYRIKPTL